METMRLISWCLLCTALVWASDESSSEEEPSLGNLQSDQADRDPEAFLLLQVDSVPDPTAEEHYGEDDVRPSKRQPSSLAAYDKASCASGRKQWDEAAGRLKACRGQRDCSSPYFCDLGLTGQLASGYCCLEVSEQEPPPVGCPFGTRALKTNGNVLVTCTPGVARYNGRPCPGDATCYFDSVEKTNKCCGRDPGEGCPSGSKAVKAVGTTGPLICTPGDLNQACPSHAICQWSYLIDRYQCCESDNGCPTAMIPSLSPDGQVRTCQSGMSTSGCSVGESCEFNFWSAGYQCCGRDYGLCPVGQVPYMEAKGARSCESIGQSSTCPTGYVCTASSTGQAICCAGAGKCPTGLKRVEDAAGRVAACNPTTAEACTAPASCQPAQNSVLGQYICCGPGGTSSGQCPSGRIPYPSSVMPQQCGPGFVSCPIGMFCETSASLGRSICCNGNTNTANSCPTGWALSGGVAQYCVPTLNQCRVGASCQASSTTAGQFLCCVSSPNPGTTYTCPLGTPVLQGGGNQRCSVQSPNCGAGATCQAATGAAGVFICCNTVTQMYNCPGTLRVHEPMTLCSTQVGAIPCAGGATCQPAVGQSGVNICCDGPGTSPVYTCANGLSPQTTSNGINAFCSVLGSTAQCQTEFACAGAANSPSTLICCPRSQSSQLTCPGSATILTTAGAYPRCTSPGFQSNCPQGYVCLAAANQGSEFVCCRLASSTLLCQGGVSPQPAVGGGPQLCTPGGAGVCQNGYSCQAAANSPSSYVCCGAAANQQPACPGNAQPYTLQPGNQISYCTQLNPSCPNGYSCQASVNRQGTFLCCANSPALNPTCPDAFVPYLNSANNVIYCNPGNAVSRCPSNSLCLTAVGTASTTPPAICCRSGTGNTVCPAGASAQTSGGQVTYCIGPNGVCQTGFSCQVSPTLGRYVCCTTETLAVQCASGMTVYRPNNNVFYCNPASGSSACPANYDCSPSTQANVNVCCYRGSAAPNTCNSGRVPYRPTGNVVYCQPGSSNICPSPTTVCEASNVANTFICCSATQSPSSLARCPDGYEAYNPAGSSSADTCPSLYTNTCPAGYSCAQSTLAGTLLCCRLSRTTTLRCYNGGREQMDTASSPKYCNVQSPNCAPGYSCQASTQFNVYICCEAAANPAVVGVACPSGQTPELSAGAVRFCTTPIGSSSGCSVGNTCQQSTRAGFKVCCSGSGISSSAKCIGRQSLLLNGQTRPCQLPNTCPNGYECSSYTTDGQYYCCAVTSTGGQAQCPGDAEPYHDPDTNALHYCSNTNFKCPDGFVCKGMINGDGAVRGEYICCSAKPGCQRGWLPYLDSRTLQKKTCSPFDTRPCSPPGSPYKCQLSTVPGTYLCCMESMIDLDQEDEENGVQEFHPLVFEGADAEEGTTTTTTQVPVVEPVGVEEEETGWVWEDGILVEKSGK